MRSIPALAAALVLHHASFILAQGGSLTPPGAPAPTMKTLDQVEPRIIVNSTNTPGDATSLFKITQPGSYYLTGNLTGVSGKHGIVIVASGVKLDLNGFDMAGVAGMGNFTGVIANASGLTNIAVVNGSVRNWGDEGVNLAFLGSTNCRVEGVLASGNAGTGIGVGPNSVVINCGANANATGGITTGGICTIANCSASNNTSTGFSISTGSTISACLASNNASTGISAGSECAITNCSVSNNTTGISTSSGCTLLNCSASSNTVGGISINLGCTISNCSAYDNTGYGISTNFGCTLVNCTSYSNTGNGISASDGSTLTSCTAHNNDSPSGIVAGTGSTLTNCTARNNTGVHGIFAGEGSTLNGCTAFSNDVEFGIFADLRSTVSNCTASGNNSAAADSWGISAGAQCTISQCSVSGNLNTNGTPNGSTGGGIVAGNGSTVQNCSVAGNKGDGIRIFNDSRVVGNTCDSNGFPVGTGDAAGIHSSSSDNRIEGNNVSDNTRGIDVDGAGNLIIKNSAAGNNLNYDIVAGNSHGPLVNVAGVGDISGVAAASHPWANFSY